MAAYYNEHDPYAAQWLRNLIAAGLIAPGDVDERSIEERIGLTGMARGATAAHEGEALERAGIHPGAGRAGPVNGLWRDADWLFCRDGKWRPVEPGAFPLANGAASRVGRLRAYGNAINVEAAKEFIAAYLETKNQ